MPPLGVTIKEGCSPFLASSSPVLAGKTFVTTRPVASFIYVEDLGPRCSDRPPNHKRETAMSNVITDGCTNGRNGRVAVPEGFAAFVDLENISWLTPEYLGYVADHLSKRYGPLAFIRVFVSPTLLQRFGPGLTEPPIEAVHVKTSLRSVDSALIENAKSVLHKLPRTVAVFSGDGDFAELVAAVSYSGRKPVVVANKYNISQRLVRAVAAGKGDIYVLSRSNRAGHAVTTQVATSKNQTNYKVQQQCATKAGAKKIGSRCRQPKPDTPHGNATTGIRKKKVAPPPTTFATSPGIYMCVTPAGPRPPNRPRTIQASGEYLKVPPIAPTSSPATTTSSRNMSTSSPPANRTSKAHRQAAANPSCKSKPTAPTSPGAGF